jgi:glycosyltransferase involved in cell wall biosynthesis
MNPHIQTNERSDALVAESAPVPQKLSGGPILLMVNSLEVGGTERQFVQLAGSLRADCASVHLACVRKKGPFLEGLDNIREFRLGGSLYGLQSMKSRWRLMRSLQKLEIAVAHAFDFYSNLVLIPAAVLAQVPVVIGSHRQLGDLLTPAQFRVQLAAFRWCDRVVCNSEAAAERLLRAGFPRKKVVVIGNALPVEAFAVASPAIPRGSGKLRVGMIARMNAAYKNHRLFLRAAARLRQRFENVEFVVVGDGPLRAEIEREALELGLQGKVDFLGDRRDVPAVLASLDISVVPSASESLSNVLLESMAGGVPVVASDVGGNRELAGDERAVLVSPNDDKAFAAEIERLLTDSQLRAHLSSKARQFARANFSVELIRDRYRDLYAEVLDQKRRGRVREKVAPARGKDSRLRVAFVAPSLRYVGGQSVQADLLMRYWKDDEEVTPQFIAVDPELPHGLRWIEKIRFLRTIVREPLYLLKLWSGLRAAEIVHIFSASYSSFLLAPLPAWGVARLLGKRTIINYRSGECRDHLQKSGIARWVLKRADLIVVPSGYLVDVLREFGMTAQIVPNLIDLSQFHYRLREKLRPHLICTRGFHPYYGIDGLVRAFVEVKKTYPEAQLDLVGGGAQEGKIRELVHQLNLSGVNFLGVAARNEIGRFYDRADIFVNASNLDNMPVSVLEAFASGTPVVTTAPEGMRYIVKHESTGLLSEVGEPNALAGNILRLLQDETLATKLARNGFEESAKYRWEEVRERWLSVYDDLMRRCEKASIGRSVHS